MAFSLRAMRIRDANYGSEYAARQVGQGQSTRDYDGGSVNELYWRTFGGVAHSPALPKERLRLPRKSAWSPARIASDFPRSSGLGGHSPPASMDAGGLCIGLVLLHLTQSHEGVTIHVWNR